MSIPPINRSDEELNGLFTEACKAQTEDRFTDAIDNYLLLLKCFPEAPTLHYNLGLAYYSLEDYTGSLHEFD